jgi:hypothetical protein
MEYGLSHNCSGIAPLLTAEETAPPPSGFALFYYLRLAFNIVRWDDVSIQRASRDSNALFYGALLWAISAAIIFLGTTLPKMLSRASVTGETIIFGLVLGLLFVWVFMGAVVLFQLALCHLIAKWFFGATGTFLGILRPLLLGWFVNCLILIPYGGMVAGGIAWTAVLMMVFEEVEGIGRLQAFGISAGINVVFLALEYMLPTPQ